MTDTKLVFANIRHNKGKNLAIFIIVFTITLFSFFATGLVKKIEAGIDNAKNKLGADLVITSIENEVNMEDVLYKGIPATAFIDSTYLEKLSQIPHVKNIVGRTYIATLGGMSCCDGEIQLIATDISSDYLLSPWTNVKTLNDDEIIMGSRLGANVGDRVSYFNRVFTVVDVLDKTNTGYDLSGFISFNAADSIIKDPMYEDTFKDYEKNLLSMIFISSDKPLITNNIIKSNYGSKLSVYAPEKKISEYSGTVAAIKNLVSVVNVLLMIIGIVSFAVITSLSVSVRKNEIGSYYVIGYERKDIFKILCMEQLTVTVLGIILAELSHAALSTLFKTAIENAIHLPMTNTPGSYNALTAVVVIILGIILSLVITFAATKNVLKRTPNELIKEAQ